MRTLAALLCTALPLAAQDGVVVSGEVSAQQLLRVRARLPAQVSRVFVQAGDTVQALDRLAVLSAPELLARAGSLEAELSREEEQLAGLAEGVKIAGRELVGAERRAKAAAADLPAAQQDLELPRRQLAEVENLYQAGRRSLQELDAARQQLREAEQRLRQAERLQADTGDALETARLRQVQANLAVTTQRHAINAARGRKEEAQALLQQCEVKSMLGGARVVRVLVGQGDVVEAGSPLLELVDDRVVRLELRVPQLFASRVQPGTAVQVLPPDGGAAVAAKVARVRGVVDGDGCMGAEVELDNQDRRWLHGMAVKAELQLAAGK